SKSDRSAGRPCYREQAPGSASLALPGHIFKSAGASAVANAARARASALHAMVIAISTGENDGPYLSPESPKRVRPGRQLPALARRLRASSWPAGLGAGTGPIDDRPSHHGQFRECRQARHRRERGRTGASRRAAALSSVGVLTFMKGAPPP